VFSNSGEFLGMAGSSPDITERKKVESKIEELLKERELELDETQTNFEHLINTMAEGVVILDKNGHIQFINPAAVAVFNVPEKQLIGYHLGIPASEGINEMQIRVEDQTRIFQMNAATITLAEEQAYLVTLRDITLQRKSMEQVRMLSHRLVTAQEKERRQIGGELHDEIGGALTGMKLLLAKSEKKLGKKAQSELKKVNDMLDETMDLVSNLSHSMRPDILDEYGLVEALEWYFTQYKERTGIKVNFKPDRSEREYPGIIETTAYRIIQESLTNVARYAEVDKATVVIWSDSEKLYIQVEDRGSGFDPHQIDIGSSGISGMQDRALAVGGALAVDSSPGKGTSVSCELPFRMYSVNE
jgi:signal transduction histidine kinase